MKVYIVNFRTTGETWHIAVCGNFQALSKCLGAHGLLWRHYGTDESDFQEWYNDKDKSQTATVSRVTLLE